MTTVYLAPTFGVGFQAFTTGGLPLNAGQIYTYLAGTTTPQATYTTSSGSVQNDNPIVLGADGRPASEIWLVGGISYRFDLKDSLGNLIKTYDSISGINDISTISEWLPFSGTPTYINATSFTVTADQTGTFQVGRRVKSTVTAGTSYGTITASVFGAVTTVTVDTTGSNALDSGLSAVSYGLLSAANFSQSIGLDAVTRQSASIASAATVVLNAAGGDYVHITGVTGITAITLAQGHERTVIFDGILTLTNGASLILPGGANITTAAGDTAIFRGEAAGVVRVITYQRGSSVPLGAPGQLVGTSTNDSASAGNVGENMSVAIATGAAVSLTSNAALNVTAITLTAGDWDVYGAVYFNLGGATNVQYLSSSISTTTGTMDFSAGRFYGENLGIVPGNAVAMSAPIPPIRVSVSGSTPIFLVAQSGFTVSTCAAWGVISARRAR